MLAVSAAAGVFGGIAYILVKGPVSASSLAEGVAYGLLISLAIGVVGIGLETGPVNLWLGSLPFTISLLIRSVVYAAIIVPIQFFQLGTVLIGRTPVHSAEGFWGATVYSAAFLVAMNLVLGVGNIIGPRAFLNFITGRYHAPVEENRFVLFVDIAGSTGLAERLGGIGIHRFLDRTFRLLTRSVVDYRGEVLNYIGDEVIVTWPEDSGAIDCRPLHCFVAMRAALSRVSRQFEREFGAAPRIRGSLHFGPVIVGEIGDVKRAIVFNGDVMNTAARLEELSRTVDGGFLASRAAMQRFTSTPPFAVRDLGELAIRGRADGIEVVGLDAPASI